MNIIKYLGLSRFLKVFILLEVWWERYSSSSQFQFLHYFFVCFASKLEKKEAKSLLHVVLLLTEHRNVLQRLEALLQAQHERLLQQSLGHLI